MRTRIVVGVDGSAPARRAIEWCATHALALDAEVVVVHALEIPTYTGIGPPYIWLASPSAEEREARRDVVARDWSKPLADAGVAFRVVLVDGDPATAIMETARNDDAALVVAGQRGLGGFRELVLGSTSHRLSHHLDRPLVIVP